MDFFFSFSLLSIAAEDVLKFVHSYGIGGTVDCYHLLESKVRLSPVNKTFLAFWLRNFYIEKRC